MVPVFTPAAIGETVVEEPVYTPGIPQYKPVTLGKTDIEPIDYLGKTPYAPHQGCYLPDDTGYVDDTISVRIEKFRVYDTDCLATWVQIASPTQFRTALAGPYPSTRSERVANMGKQNDAVVAISGDWFAYHNFGYVVRNTKTLRKHYNEQYDTLIIDENGDFTIIQETSKDKIDAFQGTMVHSFTFGPGLVVDGVQQTNKHLRESRFGGSKETQRMAICQMDTLSYLIVCTEGPENPGSRGLTGLEIAQVCHDLGAKQAYNLDGGSSSTLAMQGRKINSISSRKIRSVGDILYFVTGYPDEAAGNE